VALNALADQTLKSCTAKVTAQALREVGDLIEPGHLTPVIDRTYSLAEAAAAVALAERGSPEARSSSSSSTRPTAIDATSRACWHLSRWSRQRGWPRVMIASLYSAGAAVRAEGRRSCC
jgi:hypothetical protein